VRAGWVEPAFRINLNGDRFLDDPATPLTAGDVLILISADVGG
jgi:molybdopterin converting factor small subunit